MTQRDSELQSTDSTTGVAWQIGKYQSNDIAQFSLLLRRAACNLDLAIEVLGKVAEYPIYLLTNKHPVNGPHLLIAAGFHGEEPAGCWGLLHFLENSSARLWSQANVSFLPLVNPTGFRSGRRENDWGENPNRGFCHTGPAMSSPSREGQILLAHSSRLIDLARDGFLSLHEDSEADRAYLYSFEASAVPGPFSEALRNEVARFFTFFPDGILEGGQIRNGIIFNDSDGSFEDFLFHCGIPRTACTETPCLMPMELRVQANAAIIASLLQFSIEATSHK